MSFVRLNIVEFDPGLVGTIDPLLERIALRAMGQWVWTYEPFTQDKMNRLRKALVRKIEEAEV